MREIRNIEECPLGCLPFRILSRIMLTCLSRSGRVCSCQKPTTWPNSCTTIPNLSQFFPILIAWAPFPLLPTNEQHLQTKQTKFIYNQYVNITKMCIISIKHNKKYFRALQNYASESNSFCETTKSIFFYFYFCRCNNFNHNNYWRYDFQVIYK